MNIKTMGRIAAVGLFGLSASAQAAVLQITFENTGASDDFVLTPLWVGLHNGNFDLFDDGSAASPGLALLAETGSAAVLSEEFAAMGRLQLAGIGNADGFAGAPVVEGGETAVGEITIMNPAAYNFLSFATMLIPTNDAFFGNEDPNAYRIFNEDGSFANPAPIELFGSDIRDAGSEVNDTFGAPFSTIGGTDSRENGVVGLHPGLENFVGTGTPAGQTIGRAPGDNQLLVRITFTLIPDAADVPEPATAALLGFGLMGLGLRNKRRRKVMANGTVAS